jgi:linoleoyl-CoA desaturase
LTLLSKWTPEGKTNGRTIALLRVLIPPEILTPIRLKRVNLGLFIFLIKAPCLLPKFSSVPQSFHTELKKRISNYFEEVGKSTTGNYNLFLKAVILMVSFVFIYIHLVFFTPECILVDLESVLLRGVVAAIGFNVMHDGAHGSFSKYKWVNVLAAFSLNILGGNSFMWNMKHNVVHHSYTNVDGVDDDIDIQPWMRMSETQKRYKLHRYQHLYFWFLYLSFISSGSFVLDYQKYFKSKVGTMPLKKMSLIRSFCVLGFQGFHAFLFVFLPIYRLGWYDWMISFTIFTMVAGFVLSMVFQLAHTVEHTAFPCGEVDRQDGRRVGRSPDPYHG